jgi:cardiolipin synthase
VKPVQLYRPRQILIWSLILTVVFEAITLLFRFVFTLQSNESTLSNVGWMTGGIRIHHGFFGVLLLLVALWIRSRQAVLVSWLIIVGGALIASDLVHHFLVLWPLTGDPQFSLVYPKPAPEADVPRRLLSWTAVLLVGEWAIRLVMLFTIVASLKRRSAASALAWLSVIFFEPILGWLLYLFIGRPPLAPWRRERLARLPGVLAPVFDRLREHPNITHPTQSPEIEQAVRLATRLGRLPILGGNAVELLTDYHETIRRLVVDIDEARDHVHLLYYIFTDDRTASPVIDALARAVARGVTCRVLVDAFGSRPYLGRLLPKLTDAGVRAWAVRPVGLFSPRTSRIDVRNHRKIAIIDGKVGYTGSQNLVDPVYGEGLTYEELQARVTGPVVLELQSVFVSDWYLEVEEVLQDPALFPDPHLTGDVPAQVLPSGPDLPYQNYHSLLVALLHGARERIFITTPYFIPDDALFQALQTAVLRGVSVHLVVSKKMDQYLVGLAQRSYYEQLLDAGVQVHRYRGKFLHAKHLSIDGEIAFVGSSNMDMRSFALNAEVCILFYDREVTAQLRAVQEGYLKRCERLSLEDWCCRPRLIRLVENFARLFSPLL